MHSYYLVAGGSMIQVSRGKTDKTRTAPEAKIATRRANARAAVVSYIGRARGPDEKRRTP